MDIIIATDFCSVEVWMVEFLTLISNKLSKFSSFFETIHRAPVKICIIVIKIFHKSFCFLSNNNNNDNDNNINNNNNLTIISWHCRPGGPQGENKRK